MEKLDLTLQSFSQLEQLLAKEEKFHNKLSQVLIKIDEICQDETGLSLDTLCEAHEYSIDRLNALRSEIKRRTEKN